MTNGEKFKEVFKISQVDEGELYVYAWLPTHDAVEISLDWWNAEYEPTIKEKLNGCRGLRENLIEDIRNIYMSAHAHIEVEEVINKYIPSVCLTIEEDQVE